MDGQFGLEFADPPLGRRELLAFRRSQARDEPSVDLFLPPPGVDRLIADTEVAG